MKKILLFMVTFVFLCGIERCQALKIIRDFSNMGAAPNNCTGTGNFTNIINAACDVWELIIRDDHTIILHFRWEDVGGGQHDLITQGGTPNRETEGLVRFNNNNNPWNFSWYLDSTPLVCAEGTNTSYTEQTANLGGGQINATRCYRWYTAGPQMDLFTAALHEIGHALGMSFANTCFLNECSDGDIDFLSGSWCGMTVPLQHNNAGVVSHIDYVADRPLMTGSYAPGERVLPSVLDIISLANLSGFTQLNTNLVPLPAIGQPYKKNGKKLIDLSWIQPLPTPAGTQYALQSCTDLTQANWTAVTNAVVNTNGRYKVSVPFVPTSNMFFRMAVIQQQTMQLRSLQAATPAATFTKEGVRSLDPR